MTPEEIAAELEPLTTERNPVHYCYQLVGKWRADSVTPDQVTDGILRFMEEHTDVDFGLPGPLVAFMETAAAEESYADSVVRSIQRKPVHYTIWMLDRLLKVTSDPIRRKRLTGAMYEARRSPYGADLREDIDDAISRFEAHEKDETL
jgi:hypothetical protein